MAGKQSAHREDSAATDWQSEDDETAEPVVGDDDCCAACVAGALDQPPPYSAVVPRKPSESDFDHQKTLDCILAVVSLEPTESWPRLSGIWLTPYSLASPAYEIERTRNFLLFTMAVDYDCRRETALRVSQEDSDFFMSLGRWFLQLHQCQGGGTAAEVPAEQQATLEKRKSLLWRFVYAPTLELGEVPVDAFVGAVLRYTRSMERHREFRSCVTDMLVEEGGWQRLADKLYMDHNVLVPELTKNQQLRAIIRKPVRAACTRYFEAIGPPAWPVVHVDTRIIKGGSRVPFELTPEAEERRVENEKRLEHSRWLSEKRLKHSRWLSEKRLKHSRWLKGMGLSFLARRWYPECRDADKCPGAGREPVANSKLRRRE